MGLGGGDCGPAVRVGGLGGHRALWLVVFLGLTVMVKLVSFDWGLGGLSGVLMF